MIQLYDRETGASLGAITEEQLQFLATNSKRSRPRIRTTTSTSPRSTPSRRPARTLPSSPCCARPSASGRRWRSGGRGRDEAASMSGSLPADHFVDRLVAAGFDFFVGVPCSLVKTLLAELERRGLYLGETREDAALAVAAGAYLAGRTPVVVMQNSGWGCRSTPRLAALSLPIPALLLVTWRGYQGEDAPEHLVMGEVLPRLLELFDVPFRAPPPEALEADVDWAAACIRETGRPVALVVRPGIFE